MSSTLQTFCASAPADEVGYLVIKLECPLWPVPKRWVQGSDAAPMSSVMQFGEAGGMHDYTPAAITADLPPRTDKGSQQFRFAIQTLEGSGIKLLRDTLYADAPISSKEVVVTVGYYLVSDLANPKDAFSMLGKIAAGGVSKGITVNCAINDFTNMAFPPPWLPDAYYTPDNAPGLKYV